MDGKEIGGLTKSAVGAACVGWPGILRLRLRPFFVMVNTKGYCNFHVFAYQRRFIVIVLGLSVFISVSAFPFRFLCPAC
jgi:hypothetical protein